MRDGLYVSIYGNCHTAVFSMFAEITVVYLKRLCFCSNNFYYVYIMRIFLLH